MCGVATREDLVELQLKVFLNRTVRFTIYCAPLILKPDLYLGMQIPMPPPLCSVTL